jgi:hypothetical protein
MEPAVAATTDASAPENRGTYQLSGSLGLGLTMGTWGFFVGFAAVALYGPAAKYFLASGSRCQIQQRGQSRRCDPIGGAIGYFLDRYACFRFTVEESPGGRVITTREERCSSAIASDCRQADLDGGVGDGICLPANGPFELARPLEVGAGHSEGSLFEVLLYVIGISKRGLTY